MKVTVLVMTYNHERFIAQAIESALQQNVDFDYEIIISEDCSTDSTRNIVLDYGTRYPHRIRLLLSKCNLHSNETVARGIRAARGTYIALLDGDDYWTSARKLQKQVDFLDGHANCTICFHNAQVVHEDGSRPPWLWTPAGQKAISTLEDIWQGNFIATSATMFRTGLIAPVPDWYSSLFPITDWPLHILNAQHGEIGYISETMSVYRFHAGGLYSQLEEAQKLESTRRFYQVMNANLDYACDKIIKSAHARFFFDWAQEYLRRDERRLARNCLLRSLAAGRGTGVPLRAAAKLAILSAPDAIRDPIRRLARIRPTRKPRKATGCP